MADLAVTVDGRELAANWTDENPETRAALADALPLSGEATRWGEELYFSIPVDVPPENAREGVEVGAIAYWPAGTRSASSGGRPRRAGARSRAPPRGSPSSQNSTT